ncbi:MAG: hypothetical protein MI922_23760, partial [Bacteroidales bacterium]|nr:hypothetical protein [Bacteroidales bacterium]
TGSKEIIDDLEKQVIDWRKSLASEGENVGNDVTEWRHELGDSVLIQKYFKGYIKAFNHLARMPDEVPGVTGEAAKKILRESNNLQEKNKIE